MLDMSYDNNESPDYWLIKVRWEKKVLAEVEMFYWVSPFTVPSFLAAAPVILPWYSRIWFTSSSIATIFSLVCWASFRNFLTSSTPPSEWKSTTVVLPSFASWSSTCWEKPVWRSCPLGLTMNDQHCSPPPPPPLNVLRIQSKNLALWFSKTCPIWVLNGSWTLKF